MTTVREILRLYEKYGEDLKNVRRQQYWFRWRYDNDLVRRLCKLGLRRRMLFPAIDDIEAEITYLLVRELRPSTVLEMSPNAGWSTTWILRALRDNGEAGRLWSYDLHDTSRSFVPMALAKDRWHLICGDARETLQNAPKADYLFIDSDHSKEFAMWYVESILKLARSGSMVSVHDVFHKASPSEEGEVVIDWLAGMGSRYWTVAPAANLSWTKEIQDHRLGLGLDYIVQPRSDSNSMMFFSIP